MAKGEAAKAGVDDIADIIHRGLFSTGARTSVACIVITLVLAASGMAFPFTTECRVETGSALMQIVEAQQPAEIVGGQFL